MAQNKDTIRLTPEMENEVRARVDFKLDELVSVLKNRIGLEWSRAFAANSQKHSHYWEAFKDLLAMVEKERNMPPPYDEMAFQKKRAARDIAVEEISNSILSRGRPDYHHKQRVIASAVEKAQIF